MSTTPEETTVREQTADLAEHLKQLENPPAPSEVETEGTLLDGLRKKLAELPADEVRELLAQADEQRALQAGVGVTREQISEWFPLKGQPQGVRQCHEQAQLLAFKLVSHCADKRSSDLAVALRHLRESMFYMREQLGR